MQHNPARKMTWLKRTLAATAATCLLVCVVGSAEDKSPKTAGQAQGQKEDQAAAQAANKQWSSNAQWIQENAEEIKKADTPDKLFLLRTAEQSIYELLLTKTAEHNAQSDKVKELAIGLHKDEQQLTRQVQKLIQQQGLQMPQGISPLLQQELKVLQAQQGEQFDMAFISALKASHAQEISKFADMAKVAKDDSVKQFASEALPTLQQHAQLIRDSALAIGLPGGPEAQPAGVKIQGSEK